MNTFEITIQRKAGTVWPIVVEQCARGVFLPVRDEGQLHAEWDELKLHQCTPREYGTLLGQAVFRDLRDTFVQARAKSDDRLHVLLFVEDSGLKGLRWERLCAPLDGGWNFLALDQRTPFSLYLPSVTDRRFPPIGRRDLRALVVVANPQGLEKYRLRPFDASAAIAGVRTALGQIPCDVLAVGDGAVGPPTLDTLCERITTEQYTLLHIVGHGQYRFGGETILYLATADNQVDSVTATRLLDRFSKLRGARGLPHFSFLSICESAMPEAEIASEGALGGLAQRLVRELGIPAVLAMTEKVSVVMALALAERFYRRLREHGSVDQALVEAMAGLAERPEVNVPALFSRLGGRPLFNDKLDRPLTLAEIRFGLDHARALIAQRAPIWLKQRSVEPRSLFDEQAEQLRQTLTAEYGELLPSTRHDRESALEMVDVLCEEAAGRRFDQLALAEEAPPYDVRCPFRGLYHFRLEDNEFFFGREALIGHLQQRLTKTNVLAVLGPSGSGKSSLILAGMLPAMQAAESKLKFAYMTPGSDPVEFLDAVLQAANHPSLLIVDQFEELFTLCTVEFKRQAFIDRFIKLHEHMRVVITMRADFLGECAAYRELKELVQSHLELVGSMTMLELRRAMEKQASKVNLRFEADLCNTILDDVSGEPGAMPLLQHALRELWQRRHGSWLKADEYRALGGVKEAIKETAEVVYRDLSEYDQERMRDMFIRLTRMDANVSKIEGRRDTRQRVTLDELTPIGLDPAQTKKLVNRLAAARLLVTNEHKSAGKSVVEVAHEALISYWPKLQGWLDEDRASLRLRASITDAAQEWQAHEKDSAFLVHRGSRLEDASMLQRHTRLRLNQLEHAYVDACVTLRESEKSETERQQREKLEAVEARLREVEARRQAETRARFEAEQRAEQEAIVRRHLSKLGTISGWSLIAIIAAIAATMLCALLGFWDTLLKLTWAIPIISFLFGGLLTLTGVVAWIKKQEAIQRVEAKTPPEFMRPGTVFLWAALPSISGLIGTEAGKYTLIVAIPAYVKALGHIPPPAEELVGFATAFGIPIGGFIGVLVGVICVVIVKANEIKPGQRFFTIVGWTVGGALIAGTALLFGDAIVKAIPRLRSISLFEHFGDAACGIPLAFGFAVVVWCLISYLIRVSERQHAAKSATSESRRIGTQGQGVSSAEAIKEV